MSTDLTHEIDNVPKYGEKENFESFKRLLVSRWISGQFSSFHLKSPFIQ